MPFELNGTYWSMQELSEKINKSYTYVYYRCLDQPGYIPISGRMAIVEDALAQQVIAENDSALQTVGKIATRCRVGHGSILQMVIWGLPHVQTTSGQIRIREEVADAVANAFQQIKGQKMRGDKRDRTVFEIAMQAIKDQSSAAN